ncbi:MAG: sulfurtransferase complex subunit TusC [Nitrospinota bacterium]
MADVKEHEEEQEVQKKFLFVMRKPPHGSIYPYEGLEVILIVAAYEQILNALFMDDGVLVLKKGQETEGIGVKEFSKTYKVLEDYGVENLWVDKDSMEARGLTADDLITDVTVIESGKIKTILQEHDIILPF